MKEKNAWKWGTKNIVFQMGRLNGKSRFSFTRVAPSPAQSQQT